MTISLWEILVPTERSKSANCAGERLSPAPAIIISGGINISACHGTGEDPPRFYTTRFHRVWDEKVRAITGGLTIMTPAKGQWIAPSGMLFVERMIPVRIMATREQIDTIIDMTMKYYSQRAVLCYRLSDEVILKHQNQKISKPGLEAANL